MIYRKDGNRYIYVKSFDTANSGVQTLQLPAWTPAGEYRIDYGHIFSSNDFTQYGTSTFFVTSSSKDNGCSNGQIYSSTTGLLCNGNTNPTIKGCTPGFNFSSITGQRCPSPRTTNPTVTSTTSVAQCLKNNNATLYGASWCSHCQSQKNLFGSEASIVPYVECSNSDQSQTQACIDKNIVGYPTWIFADGSIETGELPLAKLADKTSCVLPSSTTTK